MSEIIFISLMIGGVSFGLFLFLFEEFLISFVCGFVIFGVIMVLGIIAQDDEVQGEKPIEQTVEISEPIIRYTTEALPSILDKPIIMEYNDNLKTITMKEHYCIVYVANTTTMQCFKRTQ